MKHFASPSFWALHKKLPDITRTLADKILPYSKKIQAIHHYI